MNAEDSVIDGPRAHGPRDQADRLTAQPGFDGLQERRIFISHRHTDKHIADVLRMWVEKTALAHVTVFQSSHTQSGPRLGESIRPELLDELRKSQVLVLIYTGADQDWSWCMWECGVATAPKSPDTRIVVLQCTEATPAVYLDHSRVLATDKPSVERFVRQLLTQPNFFPGLQQPIVGPSGSPDGPRHAAADLYEDLQEAIKKLHPQKRPWHAHLRLRIGVPMSLHAEPTTADAARGSEAQPKAAFVKFAAEALCRQFGLEAVKEDTPLLELARQFDSKSGSTPRWLRSLQYQIESAASRKVPRIDWRRRATVVSEDGVRYTPVLCYVEPAPYESATHFDVYFLRYRRDRWRVAAVSIAVVAGIGVGAAIGMAIPSILAALGFA